MCSNIKEMTKANKTVLPQKKRGRRRTCTKNSCKSEKSSYNDAESLQEKYKHILGSKKPVVMLQRCSMPLVTNKICLDSHINSNEIICENDFNDLTQDESKVDGLNETIPSSQNIKLETLALPEEKPVKEKSNQGKRSKRSNNKSTENSSLLKNEGNASIKNDVGPKFNLSGKKHNVAVQTEPVKSSTKKRKDRLRSINYDENSNTINRNSQTEKKYLEHSDTVSIIAVWEQDERVASRNTKVEQKHDSCNNVNDYQCKTENSNKNSMKTVSSTNGMATNVSTHAEASNANNNHVMIKKNSFALEKGSLLSNQAEDYKNSVDAVPENNVPKLKKSVTIAKTTFLPENDIEMNSKKSKRKEVTDLDELPLSQKLSVEKTLYKCSSTNVQIEINKTSMENAVEDNLVSRKVNNESNEEGTKNTAIVVKESHILPNLSNKIFINKYNKQFNTKDRFGANTNAIKCSSQVSKISVLNTNRLGSCNSIQTEPKNDRIIIEQEAINKQTETVNLRNATEPSNKNKCLIAKKRANTFENTVNESTKRIKLNRNLWLQSFSSYGDIKQAGPCNESSVAESNANRITEVNTAIVTEPDVVHNKSNKNESVEIVKMKNNKTVSDLIIQQKIELINKGTIKQECDSLQNVRKSQETTLEMQKSPATDLYSVSDQIDSSNVSDDDKDLDCMSLYPDAELLKEFDDLAVTPAQQNSYNTIRSCEKSYEMSDNVFINYYTSTASEFNKVYETNLNDCTNNNLVGTKKPLALRLGKPIYKKAEKEGLPQKQGPTKAVGIELFNLFRGFCYQILKTGRCPRQTCTYKHDFVERMVMYYNRNEQLLLDIINALVSHNYLEFLKDFYKELLYKHPPPTCVLKVLKKFYEHNVVTDNTILDTITSFQNNRKDIKSFLLDVTEIVSNNDTKFINWILKEMDKYLIHYINNGEYWNTLKPLLRETEYIDTLIVTNILRECVSTRKNVQDVQENVLCKINTNCICQKLLSSFRNLLKCTENEKQVTKEITSPESIRSTDSPALSNEANQMDVSLFTIKNSQAVRPKVWVDTSSKTKKIDNNNNTQNKNDFPVYPIDNLSEPCSPLSRNRFWKFYLDVHSLKEGLRHNDHDHVIKVLNSAKQDQKTFFSRACFRILCNEIKYSQYHLSELASLAVRIGATAIAYEILLEVMIRILSRLAEKELWVIAFKLLRDTNMIIKFRKYFSQLDAATILLFIEIYLANQQAAKCFTLLKQTNILYTDRSKWIHRNDAKDDYVRARLIALLLDTFCHISLEHAVFLFQFLIINQSSNFYPVDLVRPANKLISIFLLRRDTEMILDIARLINNYDIALETITHRALTAVLVNIDIVLAKQFFQKAIVLGIYSDIQFYPVVYNIINSDWTKEEMYLVILNIMQQFSSNIGHAADHVNAKQLTIYILFVSVPTEKQVACDEGTNQQCVEKLKKAKTLMANILRTEFNPPISMLYTNRNTFLCKLTGKSVHQYLISNYYK